MTVLEIIKSTIDAMFPLDGATLNWDQHKVINAAIIDAVVTYDSPAGVPIPIESDTAPDGYHFFNNGVLQIADCPKLYAIWGTRFNLQGDAAGTFRCPLYAPGTTLVQCGASGYNDINLTLLATGGEIKHKLTGAESGTSEHTHPIKMGGEYGPGYGSGVQGSENGVSPSNAPVQKSTEADAKSAHNNMQPYRAINFMFRLC
jgi:microcystin-dependent protein